MLKELSVSEYGDFAVTLKVLAVLCSLLTIAKQLSINIYSPQFEKSHKFIQRSGILKWVGKNLIITSIILFVGVAATLFLFSVVNNEVFLEIFHQRPIQFFLFFLPILTLAVVLSCLALSQESLSAALQPLITIFPGILTVCVFILGIYTVHISTFSIIGAYAFCQITVLTLYVLLSNAYYTPKLEKRYSVTEHEHWYTQSNAYWISTFSNQSSIVLALIALELLGSELAVGRYATILLFVVSYTAIISPLHTFLSSQVGLLIDKNSNKMRQIISITNKIQVVIVLALLLTTISFGPQLLSYLPHNMSNLYFELILAMLLFGLSITTSIPLRILVHTKFSLSAYHLKTSRIIISALLLSILIPKYGITGAILSDTIPSILTNLSAYYICRKKLNLNPLTIK